ncbi:hypothetical protein Bbelb_250650 [Branchiostoma belcheri]|nr:hypothetical protein Bbelb_250650 [Branchiostoma belcheri]
MHRREILRLPLDGGIIPGYAQAPKLPSYRFKALVKDEMTGKETEEMLLVVDLSPDLTLHNLKADKELAEGMWAVIFPTNLCLESTDRSRQAAAGHTLIRSRYSCGQGPGSEPAQCAWEQTVHVKPPPDTPSSPETTNVCIPSPETSIPGPGRAVRPVTPPETDVTAVPGTADATKPM